MPLDSSLQGWASPKDKKEGRSEGRGSQGKAGALSFLICWPLRLGQYLAGIIRGQGRPQGPRARRAAEGQLESHRVVDLAVGPRGMGPSRGTGEAYRGTGVPQIHVFSGNRCSLGNRAFAGEIS